MLSMSQRSVVTALAAQCGMKMDTSALARIEIGARRISLDEAVAISQVLGVDFDYMTSEVPPKGLVKYLQGQASNAVSRL